MRLIHNLSATERVTGPVLSTVETKDAEIRSIRQRQKDMFFEEIEEIKKYFNRHFLNLYKNGMKNSSKIVQRSWT